jgi:hypothetical protein
MTGIGDQLREQTVDTVLGRVRVQVGGTGAPDPVLAEFVDDR